MESKKNVGMEQATNEKMGNESVLKGLKVRAITAKLRDAVIISLIEKGDEIGRFKNIELPEQLRDLPVEDYQFSKNIDGKLEFELHFAKGILPKEMPEPRPRITRAEKAAAKVQATEAKDADPKAIAPKTTIATPLVAKVEPPKDMPKTLGIAPTVAATAAPVSKPDNAKDAPKTPITAPSTVAPKDAAKPTTANVAAKTPDQKGTTPKDAQKPTTTATTKPTEVPKPETKKPGTK